MSESDVFANPKFHGFSETFTWESDYRLSFWKAFFHHSLQSVTSYANLTTRQRIAIWQAPGTVRRDEHGRQPSACVGTRGKVALCSSPIVSDIALWSLGGERMIDALSAALTCHVWSISSICHSTAHLLIAGLYSSIALMYYSNEHMPLHFRAAQQS